MTGFGSIETGLSGLLAFQRALDVTGQNLTNVNTDGYSRERVNLVADSPGTVPALYAKSPGPGQGVRVTAITRFHDQFAEVRSLQEHGSDNELTELQTALHTVEQALGEPSDTAIAGQLADFWAGWDDVANNPTDLAARTQLLQRASMLADSFHRIDTTLATQRSNSTSQLQATIVDVNSIAAQVGELNDRIHLASNGGNDVSALQDQRDLLVRQLADRVGATSRLMDDGSLDVFVGGTALVMGASVQPLQVNVSNDAARNVAVVWAGTGAPATLGGSGGGLVSAVQDVLPRYRSAIAGIAQQIHDTVNTTHATGYDLNGAPGQDFFLMGANGLEVNPALLGDPRLIAASGDPTATLDGSVAQALAASSGPDAAYRQLIGALGIESAAVDGHVQTQHTITAQADSARDATSGVNLDEEMANMVSIQHAYDASARFITAIDQALDTLINGTGQVGR